MGSRWDGEDVMSYAPCLYSEPISSGPSHPGCIPIANLDNFECQ